VKQKKGGAVAGPWKRPDNIIPDIRMSSRGRNQDDRVDRRFVQGKDLEERGREKDQSARRRSRKEREGREGSPLPQQGIIGGGKDHKATRKPLGVLRIRDKNRM